MRRPGAGCLAILGLGLVAGIVAAQPPRKDSPSETTRWWSSLFSGNPVEEAKKATPSTTPTVPATMTDRLAEQERLMNALLRRQDVILQLRTIAEATNNSALADEAQRLDDLAWKVYGEQYNKLVGVTAVKPDDAEPDRPASSTASTLRAASPTGPLPPRLQSGGRIDPPHVERTARTREGER